VPKLPVTEQNLVDARAGHIGRLLLQAHRDFSARALNEIRALGYENISIAHISALPFLDGAGTRITTLAERAGMTKQGMGQLVQDLERQGLVERVTDPTDKRAALVRFTHEGLQFLDRAVKITAGVEASYGKTLGDERLSELKRSLRDLVDA
jgi:MarR family transcriptional regulator, temperature-dependent positive regulator of motility